MSIVTENDETPLQEAERESDALSTERQMLFTDAVIAIAITLLALELPVPGSDQNGGFWREFAEHQNEYWSFLISFLVIWAHWSGHRQLFRSVSGFDFWLSRLNGLWLLMIVAMPFATKVVNGDGAFQSRFGLYAGIQILTDLIFLAMAWHIRRAGLSRDGVPPERFTAAVIRSGVLAAAFAVSIPVSFFTHWAYACWALPLVVNRGISLLRRKV